MVQERLNTLTQSKTPAEKLLKNIKISLHSSVINFVAELHRFASLLIAESVESEHIEPTHPKN